MPDIYVRDTLSRINILQVKCVQIKLHNDNNASLCTLDLQAIIYPNTPDYLHTP